MIPLEELEEWHAARASEDWSEPDAELPQRPAVTAPFKTRVIKIRYCLQCALPVDDHNIRCSQHPQAVNPIPWPAEFGPEGRWTER